jgi:hypothetical protein
MSRAIMFGLCVVAMGALGCVDDANETSEALVSGGGGGAGFASGGHGGRAGSGGGEGTAGSSGSSGQSDGGASGSGGAIVPRRTVEVRNPFGHVSIPGNLVADGDFEMTGRNQQMPWIAFDDSGQATLNFDTGGHCRSGVRCGRLSAGGAYVGAMTSPQHAKVSLSLWAKPLSGVCGDLTVAFIELESGAFVATVKSTETKADANGWCQFAAAGPNMAGQSPYVYVEVDAGAMDVLVDDVVVLAAPPVLDPKTPGFITTVPTAAQAQRIAVIADTIRRTKALGLSREPPLEHRRRRHDR